MLDPMLLNMGFTDSFTKKGWYVQPDQRDGTFPALAVAPEEVLLNLRCHRASF